MVRAFQPNKSNCLFQFFFINLYRSIFFFLKRYFRRKMGRSYLDNYPAYATCCCVNLRLGAFIISILGHIPSILYLLFCATGIEQLTKYGVSRIAAQIIVVTFIVLSLTSIPMHILLLIAALKYNERLVLIYQWFIVLYLSFDIQLIFVIVFMSLHKGFVMFSVSLLLWEVCSWLILCGIILPVVNGFRKRIRAMNI